MVRYHHRIAPAIALTVALAAAAPASARPARTSPAVTAQASAPTSANPCSEVCGAGGYTAVTPLSVASAERGATLPHNPRGRSEAAAGAGSGSPSSTIASRGSNGPRSEVVSGGGYSNPSGSPTVVRVVAPSGGFHWGDAGIGAGGAIAVLLLTGAVLGATNVRRRASRGTVQPTG
jgi:hypothetical protein